MSAQTKHVVIAALALCFAALAFSISTYSSEAERQETERMRICVKGGGWWKTSWNYRTYCEIKP